MTTYAVLIKPSYYTLFVQEGETVLDAAIRQGYDFPYSCRSATCATCMGKVLEGQIDYGDVEPYALDETAQANGFALFCSAMPKSDLVIEIEDVFGPEFKPVKTAPYKVDSHALIGENLHQIFLSPAEEKIINYVAGQYLYILCGDGIPVPFSIANAPVEGNTQIELHIHDAPHAEYTKEIIQKVTSERVLTLKGPQGRMVYRNEPNLPIIFVAQGTGIVPFKAIIEGMLANNVRRDIHLYWRAQDEKRLYMNDLLSRWVKHVPNFTYVPVIEETLEQKLIADFPHLQGHQVYVSGAPEMVYGLKKTFLAHGLKPYCIYSDAFEYFPQK
jgi:CDP-4-dehydro-6-deoxyglucose reductase